MDEIYLKLISPTIVQRDNALRQTYLAVYCTTRRKQFHVINHSRMIAIIATVANGAVRLSIGLRLVGFIHAFKSDANGHHKVESGKNYYL